MTLSNISTRSTSSWVLFPCMVSSCPRAVIGKPLHKGDIVFRPGAYKLSTVGRCRLRDDRRGVRHGPGVWESKYDKFWLWSSISRTFELICDSVGKRVIMITPLHMRTIPSPRKLTLEMLAKVAVIVDYCECKEAVRSFSDTWIEVLRKELPRAISGI